MVCIFDFGFCLGGVHVYLSIHENVDLNNVSLKQMDWT